MRCKACGKIEELRAGFCFDCCTEGERRAANRTVLQHLWKCVRNLFRRKFAYARYDICWAWERLTRTGDYAKGGYFEMNAR